MIKKVCVGVATMMLVTPCFADNGQIPVAVPVGTPVDPNNLPHSPVQYLAQGYYDLDTDVLSLSFLQSVGPCTITVTNTADEVFVQPFDSDWGTCTMYLSGTPGMYSISIETGTGNHYYGSFILF